MLLCTIIERTARQRGEDAEPGGTRVPSEGPGSVPAAHRDRPLPASAVGSSGGRKKPPGEERRGALPPWGPRSSQVSGALLSRFHKRKREHTSPLLKVRWAHHDSDAVCPTFKVSTARRHVPGTRVSDDTAPSARLGVAEPHRHLLS